MTNGTPQQPQQTQHQFAIQRVYVKDLSFETPNTPAVFTEKWEPAINIEINSRGNGIAEGVFEVVLTVTATAKLGEKVAYVAEIQQAGIFTLAGFNEQELGHMLGSYCPTILFPYAREAVSDLVSRGSFPQLLLTPINFDVLYAQHLQRQAAAQQQGEGSEAAPVH